MALAHGLNVPPQKARALRTRIQNPARFPAGSPIGSPLLPVSRRPGPEPRLLARGLSFPRPRRLTNYRERTIRVPLTGRTRTVLPPRFPCSSSPWIRYAPRPGLRGPCGSPPTLLGPRTPKQSHLRVPRRQASLRQSRARVESLRRIARTPPRQVSVHPRTSAPRLKCPSGRFLRSRPTEPARLCPRQL